MQTLQKCVEIVTKKVASKSTFQSVNQQTFCQSVKIVTSYKVTLSYSDKFCRKAKISQVKNIENQKAARKD